VLLCGPHWGRVRALINDRGQKVKEAGPSTPVKVLGLSGVPDAGARFETGSDDRTARATAETRTAEAKLQQMTVPKRASLHNLFEKLQENEQVELGIIVKTDTQGAIEAIENTLREIRSDKVALKIAMAAVGNITVNDVLLASASNAVVLGFHVATEPGVNKLAKTEGVEIRLHSIIYELVDQVRDAMAGLLEPIVRAKVVGHAEVRQMFSVSKSGLVAGCMVTDGHVTPRVKVRVKREGETIYEGSIASLRRFQNDAGEVRETQECGIRIDNPSVVAAGDILEFYEVERVAQTL
jgi:translation initiation factor IF-2